AKDRNDRFNTAVEMVQTLKEIAGDFGPEKKTQTLTALRTAVKQKPTDGKKKLSPTTIAFIALGILGVAAAGLFLSNRNSLPVASEATDTAAPVSTATVTSAPTLESTTTSAPATETPTLIPPTETLAPQIPL